MPSLTDLMVRNLQVPARGQKTYVCDSISGFGVRVSQGGTKTFVLVHGATRQRTTLGRYPVISLSEARVAARHILAERTLGRHRPRSVAWGEALTLFLEVSKQKNKPRTHRDYECLLKRHFSFGRRQLSEITAHDINLRLDRLGKTTSEQNHALVAAKIFFRWAQRRQYVQHSPCEGMQTVKRPPRERVLTIEELLAVYSTAGKTGYPFGTIVQLCILTGLRRSEVAWLRREYITGDLLILPSTATKNRREHRLPLAKVAQGLIAAIPGDEPYLFSALRGAAVFGGWSKCKTAFDGRLVKDGLHVAPWTLHDLRRTFATRLAEMETPPHVIERLLNHVSGSISGVAAIYNRARYIDEMRMALGRWETMLSSLAQARQAA